MSTSEGGLNIEFNLIGKTIRPMAVLLVVSGLVTGIGVGYIYSQGSVRGYEDELSALNSVISGFNTQLDAMQDNITDKNVQIASLMSEMELQEIQILSLQSDLESREAELEEAQRFIPPSSSLAPDFAVSDVMNKTFTLSSHLGEVVVINFMATWCGYCGRQVPEYNAFLDEYGDQVTLISISVDSSPEGEERLLDFLSEYDAPWIWARDTANLTDLYGVRNIPTTIIVDMNGYIWSRRVGLTTFSALEDEYEQLLSFWGFETVEDYVTLSVVDSRELIQLTPDIIILDVRTVSEYEAEHLEGATNIPVQELPERLGELPTDVFILVYCKSGVRSVQASEILVGEGYDYVYNMGGGIEAWKGEHLPIVVVP